MESGNRLRIYMLEIREAMGTLTPEEKKLLEEFRLKLPQSEEITATEVLPPETVEKPPTSESGA